jgi:L-lactate dehydrogenase complex protein LldF
VCPVKIDIPRVLLHLRSLGPHGRERLVMRMVAWLFGGARRFALAQSVGRVAQRPFVRAGKISRLPRPLSAWTSSRDLEPVARETFREWWDKR